MNNTLTINPSILRWAREECGYSPPEIASKIHVDQKQYAEWENSGTGLGLKDLISLSKVCKRQIAFFFLPNVPQKTEKPVDFRNLAPPLSNLSDKTMLAIRRTAQFRDFLLQLQGIEYYREKYSWLPEFRKSFDSRQDSDESVEWIRNILDYPIDEQTIPKITSNDSYKRWRNSIEQTLGIHVFQFSMPTEEVQGFSYADSLPYTITIK